MIRLNKTLQDALNIAIYLADGRTVKGKVIAADLALSLGTVQQLATKLVKAGVLEHWAAPRGANTGGYRLADGATVGRVYWAFYDSLLLDAKQEVDLFLCAANRHGKKTFLTLIRHMEECLYPVLSKPIRALL